MTDQEHVVLTQERNAAHEAGHGLVAWLLPSFVCVKEISLVPRVINDRQAAGWVSAGFNPFRTENLWLDMAAYDLLQAKQAAIHFVAQLRPEHRKFQLVVLRSIVGISIITMFKDEMDTLVREVLHASYVRAKDLIRTHRDKHTLLTRKLLERQSLTADDIDAILGKRPE